MQTHFTGGSDVHRRTLAHRFQSAQHLDRRSIILMPGRGSSALFFTHDLDISSNFSAGKRVACMATPALPIGPTRELGLEGCFLPSSRSTPGYPEELWRRRF